MKSTAVKTDTGSSPLSDKEMLDYYIKMFQMVSEQRMQTVNFYITIIVGLFGGLFVLFKMSEPLIWAECVVSAMITMISITFYGLDVRTRMLLRCCRKSMRVIESRFRYGEDAKLINCADSLHNDMLIKWSFSNCLTIQFIVIGSFGVILIPLILLHII